MKKTGLATVLIAVVSLFTFTQIGCQPAADTNRPVAPANTNSANVVDTVSIEAELLRIENDWPRVLREKDVSAVGRVEADDIVIVYPDGSIGSKERDLQDIAAGNITADDLDITELKVKVLDNDAAVVTGQQEMKNGKYKMPDGKSMDISGRYRFIDTFARRNGEWKLVAAISTKITATAASAAPVVSPTPATRVSPTPATRVSPAPATRVSPKGTPAVRVSPVASPPVNRATP